MTRRRVGAAVVALAAVVLWLGIGRLARLDDGGPVRIELDSPRGVPTWLYLPADEDSGGFLQPPDREEAPPVVVVGHGFSGDNRVMHPMASTLTRSGYAVVTLDFRGHGSNPHAFRGDVADDVIDVINALERGPWVEWVDLDRVALLGHSMGASAVVEAGARDERVSAVVAISGYRIVGPERRPANALFLVAERDPEGTHQGLDRLVQRMTRGRDLDSSAAVRDGTAVRVVEIAGTDHLSVIFDEDTVDETVRWLDATFRFDSRPAVGNRYARLFAPLLAALVLIGAIGIAAGRRAVVVPAGATPALALLALAAALVIAMPIVRMANVASFLPLAVADTLVSYLAIVAAVLAVAMRRRLAPAGDTLRASFVPAVAAFGAVYVVLSPVLANYHRITPTPKRLVAFVLAAAVCIPFFVVVEGVLRRGSPWVATAVSVGGRVLVLIAILAGASRGYLPGVVSLVVPILVGTFVLFEIFASAAYAAGRNTMLIAITEGLWLGWLVSVTLPITI